MGSCLTVFCVSVRRRGGDRAACTSFVYRFERAEVLIGRSALADIQLPDEAVSLAHARLRLEGAALFVEDLGSTNGTRLDGRRLIEGRAVELHEGAALALGDYELEIAADRGEERPLMTPQRTASYARAMAREALVAGAAAPGSPYLEVMSGPQRGQRLELTPGSAPVIGRGLECQLVLTDADASREHARFKADLAGASITDLASKNGSFVNGQRVRGELPLCHHDELRIGNALLRYRDPAEELLARLRGPVGEAAPTPAPEPPQSIRQASGELREPASAPALSAEAAFELSAASVESGPQLGAPGGGAPFRAGAYDWVYWLCGAALVLAAVALIAYLAL
ncbi:MAG: FHA domain-containing protein [Proteobacteria bacterium]|nr:FHA domain-containing protein [Pseudomonadota bacterium]